MQRFAVFLAIQFLSIGVIIAHPAFQEGFIINLSNDTISGYIGFKGNLKKLKSFKFKSELKEAPKIFSSDEIQAFKINEGSYYVSMPIEIDGQRKFILLKNFWRE